MWMKNLRLSMFYANQFKKPRIITHLSSLLKHLSPPPPLLLIYRNQYFFMSLKSVFLYFCVPNSTYNHKNNSNLAPSHQIQTNSYVYVLATKTEDRGAGCLVFGKLTFRRILETQFFSVMGNPGGLIGSSQNKLRIQEINFSGFSFTSFPIKILVWKYKKHYFIFVCFGLKLFFIFFSSHYW